MPGLIRGSINAGKGPAILQIARLQKERPLSVIQGPGPTEVGPNAGDYSRWLPNTKGFVS